MSKWCVYLLRSSTGRTYIGSTTDPHRRLRQHNGEIRGGARATRRHGPWELVCHIAGFENRSSACRWERIVKCRAVGITNRRYALGLLACGICPPNMKASNQIRTKFYLPPQGLEIYYHA